MTIDQRVVAKRSCDWLACEVIMLITCRFASAYGNQPTRLLEPGRGGIGLLQHGTQ
jgi:hypothetical protein